ncbi:hypothetical protein F5Y04DRAFT_291796 [Hypomontagnella monticulosa]|nr:hypothetical protein F5Y04DRAFT_291796 [Hypomontagnella monticulosa]
MARNKNKNWRARSPPNNRRKSRMVDFDDDISMSGIDQSHTRGRRGRGRNKPRSPNRGSNNNSHNPFSVLSMLDQLPQNQQYHNRDQRGENSSNTNITTSPNNNRKHRKGRGRGRNNDADAVDDESDVDNGLFNPRTPFLPVPWPTFNTNIGNSNVRFCTECSASRRANLRFRNWAARALQACGERVAAWADEVGVGFGCADEMDWQPEPVIRVLLLAQGASDGGMLQQQQRIHGNRQEQGHLIGPVPTPGPWPWPPWPNAGTVGWPWRTARPEGPVELDPTAVARADNLKGPVSASHTGVPGNSNAEPVPSGNDCRERCIEGNGSRNTAGEIPNFSSIDLVRAGLGQGQDGMRVGE